MIREWILRWLGVKEREAVMGDLHKCLDLLRYNNMQLRKLRNKLTRLEATQKAKG